MHRPMHCWALAATVAVLAPVPAFAHAFLDRAIPAVGSEVSSSPPSVTITYTEAVEPHFSTIEVRNAGGVRVDADDVHADDDGKRLVVGLHKLPPGKYTVVWHVTSVDTHKTEGSFVFTVTP